jgi:hypothetical protein
MDGRRVARAAALALAIALAGCQTVGQGMSDAVDETGVPPYSVREDVQGPNGLLTNGLLPQQPYD